MIQSSWTKPNQKKKLMVKHKWYQERTEETKTVEKKSKSKGNSGNTSIYQSLYIIKMISLSFVTMSFYIWYLIEYKSQINSGCIGFV